MRRFGALLALVAGLSIASVLPAAAADGPVKTYSHDVTLGFYRGRTVSYLDLGPVNLAAGNEVAPIWAVTNGADGQHNIVDTVPGQKSYTPLWSVQMVTWRPGANERLLRSAAAVRAARKAGEVTIRRTPIVVNCPVL
jgi:hypothetical protein